MKTTFFLLACMVLTSCAPVFYSNVGQNVPLFQKKGEVFLAGGISATNNRDDFTSIDGLNVMAAAAVDSNMAVLFSFYSLKTSDPQSDEWSGKGNYVELGMGLFERGRISKLTGEIFVGLGYGTINSSYNDEHINLKYLKPFIQPSGGFSTGALDIAFTPRIGLVQYVSNHSNNSIADNFYAEKKSTFIFEPGVTVRLGYRNVKLQYQLTYSTFKYSFISNYDPFVGERVNPINSYYESLSLVIMISDRWTKRNQ